jgi:hypothetical protein
LAARSTRCNLPASYNRKGVPDMSRLTKHDRLAILELATEIASESAQNPNIVWMIEPLAKFLAKVIWSSRLTACP